MIADRYTAALNDIFDFIGEADVAYLEQTVRKYRRGGLPSGNGQGRGAERPLPIPDDVDRFLERALKARENILRARALMADYVNWQRRVCNVTEEQPDAPKCENWQCGNELKNGRQSGKCDRCRQWPADHGGLDWPYEQAVAR